MMLVVVLASCTGPQQNPDFEKNVDLAKNYFATFVTEDIDATAALISDDVEWQGCFYGSPVMNKEEAVEKSIEYVNLFGYVKWHELKSIEFINEKSIWKVIFYAKQNESNEVIKYKLEVDNLSGDISNLQMIEN